MSSNWKSFLLSISQFRGDLNSLTAPAWILSPVSVIEYSQYWGTNAELLIAPATLDPEKTGSDDPVELQRFLAAIKWFIATLHSQYTSRGSSEKKPLNPFLGELFVGNFKDTTKDGHLGDTYVINEQVNHHPPITAYTMYNKKHNVIAEGTECIKAYMSATSFRVVQMGSTLLTLGDLDEQFLFTLPPLHLEGLLMAKPRIELERHSYAQASTGYFATFAFSGKGYFTGRSNTFKCRVYKNEAASTNTANALYSISGTWSEKSRIAAGHDWPGAGDPIFIDVREAATEKLVVKPIHEQYKYESRKAWEKVQSAIRVGDMSLCEREKSKIENEQREMRKKEKAAGTEWKRRWYKKVDYGLSENKDDPYIKLYEAANLSPYSDVPSGTRAKKEEIIEPATDEDTPVPEDTADDESTAASKDGDAEKPSKAHWRFSLDKWLAETEVHV